MAGLVNPFMSFHAGKQRIIGGIFQEIIDRLEGMGGYDAKTRAFDPEIMKYNIRQDHLRGWSRPSTTYSIRRSLEEGKPRGGHCFSVTLGVKRQGG